MSNQYSFANIAEAGGLGIGLTGILIVFLVLTLISVVIRLLPRLVRVLNRWFPGAKEPTSGSKGLSSLEVAAIGLALVKRRQGQIERVKKG